MKRIAAAICLAGGFVTGLILYFFDPARVPLYPVCQFHQLTGLDCPGCGSLRALHELLHGHLATALHLNLLLVLSLPLLAWLALRFVWREITGEPAVIVRPFWLWLYLAAWIAFGVLRNLPVTTGAIETAGRGRGSPTGLIAPADNPELASRPGIA